MLLMSQNLHRYGEIPADAVVRINLAWVEDLEVLKEYLDKTKNSIFLDMPLGRTKPPNNKYTLSEVKSLISYCNTINYLAISNVESSIDIKEYIDFFDNQLSIVPKIETKKGIDNINEIISVLNNEKVIMLDHDDLFLDLSRNNISASNFFEYIDKLVEACSKHSIKLLRMRGVIFSDEDEYFYK